MLKLKLQYFGHRIRRVDSLEKTDAGRDWGQEEKGTTEDEMVGWHHWLDGHETEWTPGVGDGQGGLACCNSWGCKESDTTERLNWTEPKDFLLWASEWSWTSPLTSAQVQSQPQKKDLRDFLLGHQLMWVSHHVSMTTSEAIPDRVHPDLMFRSGSLGTPGRYTQVISPRPCHCS